MPTREDLAEARKMLDRSDVLQREIDGLLATGKSLHAQHAEQKAIADAAIAEMRRLTNMSTEINDVVTAKLTEQRALGAAVAARLKGERPS